MIHFSTWRFPIIFILGVMLFLTGASVLLQPKIVHAASFASCSGEGCNGLDPARTGCSNGASTAQSALIYNDKHYNVGLVQLRFSPSCGTNWTVVTSYMGNTIINASVHRIYDGRVEYGYGKNSSIWSNMVYAPQLRSSWGSGCVWRQDGAANYCADTPIG